MEEVVRAFLHSTIGKAILFALVIVVGFTLREWTYRSIYGSHSCWKQTRGAELKAEARERERLKKELRKKYAYLNKKSSNESNSSNKSISSNENNKNNYGSKKG